jgi:hypothetical protein
MSKEKWTSLALLLLVILDATGDAFRIQGWQVLHHSIESLQVAGWLAVWILFRFNPVYIAMYILGRFVTFDVVLNLIVGNDWWYVGETSLYGRFLSWLAGLVKQPISMFVTAFKAIALFVWVAWFWTDRKFRELKVMWNG